MESLVSCGEDFGFCPKCAEMLLEDFDRTATVF